MPGKGAKKKRLLKGKLLRTERWEPTQPRKVGCKSSKTDKKKSADLPRDTRAETKGESKAVRSIAVQKAHFPR